ncbi:MAG TPA: Ig-like domain-containing protein [Gemmatimonadales bacterium]
MSVLTSRPVYRVRAAACAALMALVVACGGDNPTSPAPKPTPPTPRDTVGPTTPTQPSAPAVVRVALESDGAVVAADTVVTVRASAVDSAGRLVDGARYVWSLVPARGASLVAAADGRSAVLTPGDTGEVVVRVQGDTAVGALALRVAPAPVAQLALQSTGGTLAVGDTATLAVSLADRRGRALAGRAVTWASRDPSVVQVSGAGVMTAIAVGATRVVVSSEGRSDSLTITVESVPVTAVTIAPASPPGLPVGDTLRLSAVTLDPEGNVLAGRLVTWRSLDPASAAVIDGGVVVGVRRGTARIVATAASGGPAFRTAMAARMPAGLAASAAASAAPADTVVITVLPGAPATIRISPSAPQSAVVYDTLTFAAAAFDRAGDAVDAAVLWAVRTPGVLASVPGGRFAAVGAGTTWLIASAGGTALVPAARDSVLVTVGPARVAAMSVAPAADTLTVGDAVQLAATLTDRTGALLVGRAVTWSSSAPVVASVDASGRVSAVAPGTALVRAEVEGVRAEARITVLAPVVESVAAQARLVLAASGSSVPVPLATSGVAPIAARLTGGSLGTVTLTDGPTGPVAILSGGAAGATGALVLTKGAAADTVQVRVVAGTVGVLLADTVVAPATPMRLAGSGAASATVALNGVPGTIAADVDGRYALAPSAPWEPCLPSGRRGTLSVSGQSVDIALDAAPVKLTLAPGQYAIPTEAVRAGCPVEVQEAGEYVVMPFVPEEPRPTWIDFQSRPRFRMIVEVEPSGVNPAATPAASLVAARMARSFTRTAGTSSTATAPGTRSRVAQPTGPDGATPRQPSLEGERQLFEAALAAQRGGTRTSARASRTPTASLARTAGAFAASLPACTHSTVIGSTITVGTSRYVPDTGTVRHPYDYRAKNPAYWGEPQFPSPGAAPETWTLRAVTPRYAYYVDTAWVRVAAGDPRFQQRLDALAAHAEATIPQLFARFGMAHRDDDGNDRVVVLVPYARLGHSASGYYSPAFGNWGRIDCDNKGGEAVWFPSSWFSPMPTVYGDDYVPSMPVAVRTLAHEVGHIYEGPVRDESRPPAYSWYGGEGFARLVEVLWTLRDQSAPFTGERAELPDAVLAGEERSISSGLCSDQTNAVGAAGVYYRSAATYSATCHFFHLVGGRLVEQGMPESQVMRALATAPLQGSLTDFHNSLLRPGLPALSPDEALGAWFLSWAADGQTTGALDPALRNPARSTTSGWLGWMYRVDGRLRSVIRYDGHSDWYAEAAPGAAIEDNTARFLRLDAAGPTRVSLLNPDRTAIGGGRPRLGIVRLR